MKGFDQDSNLVWAFCMTHPDDEISICAWIKRLRDAGRTVHMSWTHSNPVREREGRAVATLLGVPQQNLKFFTAPDGDVVDHIPELIPAFSEWFGQTKPDRVCCGAFEQGHLDHDSTNLIVNQAFGGPIFEIPFYHTYLTRLQKINRFSDPSGEEVRQLDLEESKFKTTIARQYESQNIWSVLLWYEIWQKTRFRKVELRSSERMRLQTHKDFLTPSHPAWLSDKIKQSEKWRRWERAVRPLVHSTP